MAAKPPRTPNANAPPPQPIASTIRPPRPGLHGSLPHPSPSNRPNAAPQGRQRALAAHRGQSPPHPWLMGRSTGRWSRSSSLGAADTSSRPACSCWTTSAAVGTHRVCVHGPVAVGCRLGVTVTSLATLAVNGTVEGVGRPALGSIAFASVPLRSWGLRSLGPMTTRSNRPSPTARARAISGGAGTTTVAVPLTVPTHSHLSGPRVLVASRALNVMGQPPNNPPRRVAAHRSHRGADREGS